MKNIISHLPSLGLYIHIPWCLQKCYYCDFNSYRLKGKIPDIIYVKHLIADLENDLHLTSDREVCTIFIGGGTPSLMSINAIEILIDGIRNLLPLSKEVEISLEANPNSIDAEKFLGYQHIGINRISIGIQSFNSQKLKSLGRVHNSEEAKYAAYIVSNMGLKSFNLDIIHGLPNQTVYEALDDLNQAIKFNAPQISWYQLAIEPKTIFNRYPPKLPNDNILWNIFKQGHNLLMKTGYHQYEISTYAKQGYVCEHNLNYWRFNDYIGIGCGAHGKLTQTNGSIIRTVKTDNPNKFMDGKYLYNIYEVNNIERPFEFFINRFRLIEPILRKDLYLYTNVHETEIRNQINMAINMGFIVETPDSWITTEKGKLFMNSLLEIFLH